MSGVKHAKTVQMTFSYTKQAIFNSKKLDYSKYSKFNTGEDFNNDWEKIMAIYKKKFTQKQHRALTIVRRCAYKYPGVALASYSTYQEKYFETYEETISEDTLRRAIDKAEKLGILIKNFGKRLIDGHGSQTANVIIFVTYNEVLAYKAVQDAKDEAMMKELLEEEYAKTNRMMAWATEAKEMVKKPKENAQNEQKPTNNDAEKRPESNRKPKTMYKHMLDQYKPRTENDRAKFNELVAIAYATKKKAAQEHGLYDSQLERIILLSLEILLSKSNVQNQAAFFSGIIKNQIKRAVGQTKPIVQGARKEVVPEYLENAKEERRAIIKEQEAISKAKSEKAFEELVGGSNEDVDFEEMKLRALEKMREKRG